MRISVITVTWNSSATLRDTMQSVLNQSYSDVEHIIIDGASTDGTMDIVREMEPLYKGRLRYVSEHDNGLYDAMNKGIGMATGHIVGILNSDDFFTDNAVLATIARQFEADTNLDAVYGDIHFVKDPDLKKCVRYYSSRLFHRRWMRLGFMPAHPSFYCRREVYEKFGGYDTHYKIASDFDLLLRLLFVNRIRTRYIPVDCVTMRTGGVSTQGLMSHKQILSDHQLAFKQNGVYSNVLLESLRYPCKIIEVIYSRLFVNHRH